MQRLFSVVDKAGNNMVIYTQLVLVQASLSRIRVNIYYCNHSL